MTLNHVAQHLVHSKCSKKGRHYYSCFFFFFSFQIFLSDSLFLSLVLGSWKATLRGRCSAAPRCPLMPAFLQEEGWIVHLSEANQSELRGLHWLRSASVSSTTVIIEDWNGDPIKRLLTLVSYNSIYCNSVQTLESASNQEVIVRNNLIILVP